MSQRRQKDLYHLRHKHRHVSLATQRHVPAETQRHVSAETQRHVFAGTQRPLKAQTPTLINGNGIAERAGGENLPRSTPK